MDMPLAIGTQAGPTRQVRIAGRSDVKLPSLIRDQSTMTAFFRAPTSEVKKLLPSKKLRLIELVKGTTLVGFACTEYRQVEGLADYREVGIMVPVRYAPRFDIPVLPMLAPQIFRDAGYYFHRMPLTSPEAYEVGVKVHGLRKVMADIRFADEGTRRRCTVDIEGKRLLELVVKKTRTRHMKMTTQTYTFLDGKVLRTPVPSRGQMGMIRGADSAFLTLGDHYMADELRALRMSSTPIFAMYSEPIESVLCAPVQTLPA